VLYSVLLFSSLDNEHQIKDLGDGNGTIKREPQGGEGYFNDADQRTPAGTAVSQGKCLLLASAPALLLGLVTFGLSQDLMNENFQSAYNTCEINFRPLLIKNNFSA
jgi:hypothetical protein